MPTDRELVRRAAEVRRGEADASPSLQIALDDLMLEHRDRVVRVCQRIVGDRELADELAQEALLVAWRELPKFHNNEAQFGTWLHGIARNLCFNAVRKKRELLTDDGVIDANDGETLDVVGRMRAAEREILIREASRALSPVEQEAIHLRYVECMPVERITDLLAIEANSGARGLLQRCRRKLSTTLRKRLGEMGHTSSFIYED
jgi:RNA polymerase sigma-70 factor (ECF subfamily)